MKIILASNSPRRKELLELAKVNFSIESKNVLEVLDDSLAVDKRIEKIAYTKALAVAKDNIDACVIGADTVVVVDDLILGKPKDKDDARRMIKMLQGRTHKVITGVCVITNNLTYTFSESTDVTFYEMTDLEIENYINIKDIYDKAGAYAIQGDASIYIKSINGDFYNVMGLPIAKLIRLLKKLKIIK